MISPETYDADMAVKDTTIADLRERNLRLERENTLYGHALNKASIAFTEGDTESVRRLLCGYDALSFLAQLRDKELADLRERLAKVTAIASNMDWHGRVLKNGYLRGIASDLIQIAELGKEGK